MWASPCVIGSGAGDKTTVRSPSPTRRLAQFERARLLQGFVDDPDQVANSPDRRSTTPVS